MLACVELSTSTWDATQNDVKNATKLLREAVKAGTINSTKQRQIVLSWSKTPSDASAPAKSRATLRNRVTEDFRHKREHRESLITDLMKTRGYSRQEAVDYIRDGGLEAEKMQYCCV